MQIIVHTGCSLSECFILSLIKPKQDNRLPSDLQELFWNTRFESLNRNVKLYCPFYYNFHVFHIKLHSSTFIFMTLSKWIEATFTAGLTRHFLCVSSPFLSLGLLHMRLIVILTTKFQFCFYHFCPSIRLLTSDFFFEIYQICMQKY